MSKWVSSILPAAPMSDNEYNVEVYLAELLGMIRNPCNRDHTVGICENISLVHGQMGRESFHIMDVNEVFGATVKTWPYYSGNKEYPVPSTRPTVDSREAYNTFPLWEQATRYGQLRMDLLNYCTSVLRGNLV